MSSAIETVKEADGYHRVLRTHERQVRVSYFKPRQVYRKFVGGRMFYLTGDERSSRRLALIIICIWALRRKAGGKWQEMDLRVIADFRKDIAAGTQTITAMWDGRRLQYRFGSGGNKPSPTVEVSKEEGDEKMSVEVALGAFVDEIVANQLLSPAHRATMASKCETLRRCLPLGRPIESIGKDDIRRMVQYWTARPKSEKTGRRVGSGTVRNIMAALRQFMYWCDDRGIWQAPGRLAKMFAVDRRTLLTNDERKQAALGVDCFSVEELDKLWKAANEQQRLYLLLSLNCGFAQMELATLRLWEIKADGSGLPVRISRERRKSEIHGEWSLWPETADLLMRRTRRTPKNNQDLAIISRNGEPLVRYNGQVRIDSVAQTWKKLTAAAGVRSLSFKYMRKTGSSLIEKIDPTVTEMYLSHVEPGMKRVYAQRDWPRLDRALSELRNVLSPVLAAEPKVEA